MGVHSPYLIFFFNAEEIRHETRDAKLDRTNRGFYDTEEFADVDIVKRERFVADCNQLGDERCLETAVSLAPWKSVEREKEWSVGVFLTVRSEGKKELEVFPFERFGQSPDVEAIIVGKSGLELTTGGGMAIGKEPSKLKIFIKVGRLDGIGSLGNEVPVESIDAHFRESMNGTLPRASCNSKLTRFNRRRSLPSRADQAKNTQRLDCGG